MSKRATWHTVIKYVMDMPCMGTHRDFMKYFMTYYNQKNMNGDII